MGVRLFSTGAPMTHHAPVKLPPEAERAGWLAALLAECRGRIIPPELTPALHARIGRLTFSALLEGLDTIADCPDRSLAIQLYLAWIAACADPAEPRFAAWFNLGTELTRAGNADGAIDAFRHALALRPSFHPAAVNLGLQLELKGDPAGALLAWNQALQPDDVRTTLLNQQGRLLEQTGRLAEAEQVLVRSLATTPDQPDVIQHFVHIRQKMCRWPLLAPGCAPRLDLATLLQNAGPLTTLSITDDPARQTALTAHWVARKTTPAPERLSPPAGYGGRHDRLRLGYISSDFCRHAMGYLVAELFERHDRTRFSVHGYCIGRDDGSALRSRIIAGFDHFTSLNGLTDEAAARTIAADEIDILVDLNGLTGRARPQIFRWRPAPVQATYLGFIGSVPLPELDYLFCDEFVIPQAVTAAYRPAPLAIAPHYQANDRRRVIGAPSSRAAAGLPDGAFVYCCFSNHYKITQTIFAAWMTILAQVPGAILWLAEDNEWSHANLKAEASRHGIDPARLLIAPRIDPADYIARLPLADLLLDTYPYNAGTVASDALRMGLPLLTLCGQSFVARMAAGMLTALGATEGVTHTMDAYIERAVAFGTDPAAYAAYRARFTTAAWEDTVGDIAGFTAAYEATLLRIAGGQTPN